MCSCVEHYEYQLLIVLLPDQQLVRLDVTLPLPTTITMQLVWQILSWQFTLRTSMMTKAKFEEIYRRHYPAMYRLSRTILYDADDCKDAVS